MTHFPRISCFVAAALLALASAGCAASNSSGKQANTKAQAKKLIASVSHNTVQLVSTFSGPSPNIVGVIGKNKAGQKMMAWMVDGRYLVTGSLYSAARKNLTLTAEQDHGLVAKPLPPEKLAQAAMAAPGFVLGQSGPLMVSFEDPNCIYCHKLTLAAAPLIAAGKLRIRLIPVGFLKKSSARKAAAILSAKNPGQAWMKNEKTFDVAKEEGAIAPADKNSPLLKTVSANTQLLARSGMMATPTLIYCDKGAAKPSIQHGITPRWLAKHLPKAVDVTKTGGCAASG